MTTLCISSQTARSIIDMVSNGQLKSVKTLISFDALSQAIEEELKNRGLSLFYYEDLAK